MGQSSGWLMSSSSSTLWRASFAWVVCVFTTIPSATAVAHAAHPCHRQPRVIAVVRDEDAGLLGGLDHQRTLGHADGDTVDREIDELVRHQATSTGCRLPAM